MKLIVKVIFKAVKSLINLILLPLDLVINGLFPDISSLITNVNSFFNSITTGILWVKSWLPFTTTFYVVLVAVLTFNILVPFTVHTIKNIIAWYNRLKP